MNLATITKESLPAVIATMLDMPQADCEVQHGFAPGMYIRQLTVRAGVMAIGQYHKHDHLNMMLSGRVLVNNDNGTQSELVAPMVFTSRPGRKVGVILEDMVWLNIFATTETDIDTLESLIFEPNEALMTAKAAQLIARPEDVEDFRKKVESFGLTAEEVRRQSEIEDDLVQFPYGMYKCKVGASAIEGRGLIATANIKAGEVICTARIGNKRTPAGRYTNHAKEPNAVFWSDGADVQLSALRSISGCVGGLDGEEITVDYAHSYQLARGLEQ